MQNPLSTLLFTSFSTTSRAKLEMWVKAGFAYMAWLRWKARDECIFQGTATSPTQLVRQAYYLQIDRVNP